MNNNEHVKLVDQNALEKNDQNQEELFKQYETLIENYSQNIKYGKAVSFIMFLLFLVILTITTSLTGKKNWYLVLAPAVLFVISLTVVVNYYLNIQNIIDNLESNEVNIGTIISYFCLNIVSINLIVYLVLLCLKLQGVVNYPFSLISIPVYILFGISVFYFIFILPALIQTNLYFEIALIISYLVNMFAFLLLLNSKLDHSTSSTFTSCLIPVWFAFSVHLAYITFYVTFKEEHIVMYISSYLILGIIAAVSFMIIGKFDYSAKIDNWIFGVLLIVAYHFYLMEKIYQAYWKRDEEVKEEIKK